MHGPGEEARRTALQNLKPLSLRSVDSVARRAPRWGSPSALWGAHVGRSAWMLGAGCRSSLGLLAPLVLSGDGLGRWVGGRRAGAEPAGEEEALQFGLVFLEWALAPGVGWPPGSGSGAGLSQETAVAVDR